MSWFHDSFYYLFKPQSVALTVLILSVVAALGLALGSLKVRGISLGIGGVLFAGLAVGKFAGGHQLNHEVTDFAKEFGLILFVYTIGVGVGPGFLASLRKHGLALNLMAATIVALSLMVTVAVTRAGGVPMKDAVGLLAGATTNTPSLGAANEALKSVNEARKAKGEPELKVQTGATYAIAYPFGIVGIILTMVGIRFFFRVNLKTEADALAAQQKAIPALKTMNLEVTNPNLDGRPIRRIPAFDDGDIVISRVLHDNKLQVATPDTVISRGDVLLAVGPEEALDDLRVVVGNRASVDLKVVPSQITTRRILVTNKAVLGKNIDELHFPQRLGVNITRIRRGEIEIPPSPNVSLQYGDTLVAVGEEEAIKKAASQLGDSLKQLNHPQIIPVFVGIALGVILGSLPFKFPGMPAAVKLGLAGGPLIAAIILSSLGHFGPLVWYMPNSANFALRELGIVLFLACVGVNSGEAFFNALANGTGWYWMFCGALITALPLIVVALFARGVKKLNYMTLCGLLSGSMTDPPALAFAGQATGSDAPSIAYAAVYPLTMLLRVVTAQILVLIFV